MKKTDEEMNSLDDFLKQFDEGDVNILKEEAFREIADPETANETGPDEGEGLPAIKKEGNNMRMQIRIGGYMYEIIDECRRHLRISNGRKITIKSTVEYLLFAGIRKKFPEIYQEIDDSVKKTVSKFNV